MEFRCEVSQRKTFKSHSRMVSTQFYCLFHINEAAGKALQLCANCFSPELGASVLILCRTLVAGGAPATLTTQALIWWHGKHQAVSVWAKQSRILSNFPNFYQYSEWTQLMFLVTTEVWVLGLYSNKMFLEITIGLTDSFHWRNILSIEQSINYVNLWAVKRLYVL